MFKKIAILSTVALSLLITGCQRDAQVASKNLSYAADNFQLEC